MQLLQNGKQQFIDQNGLPLANGTVGYYAPGTLNPQATYQDQAGTIQNTNPITLDSRGQAIIWGTGTYRQIVKDASGVTIWDQIVDAPAGAASLSNTTGAGGAALVGFDGGTLSQFFLSKNNRVVDSIAALRGLSKTTYTRAFVTGYYSAGDGGGGDYWYDPSDVSSSDNGCTIIVAADGGRWKLEYSIGISFHQAGAKGDGTTDDTNACQAAITAVGCVYGRADATYSVGTLNIPSNRTIRDANFITKASTTDFTAPITIDGTTSAKKNILIQNVNINGNRANQTNISSATEDGGRHGFRVLGSVSNLTIRDSSATYCACDGLEIFSNGASTSDGTFCFNNILIENCTFQWNRRHGMSADSLLNVTFRKIKANNNGKDLNTTDPYSTGTRGARTGLSLSGSLYGSPIDAEGYGPGSNIDGLLIEDCDFTQNVRPALFIDQDAAVAGWIPRGNITLRKCKLDNGMNLAAFAPEPAIYFGPLNAANASHGTYYRDVNLEDNQYTSYVSFRSCKHCKADGYYTGTDGNGNIGYALYSSDIIFESRLADGISENYYFDSTSSNIRSIQPLQVWPTNPPPTISVAYSSSSGAPGSVVSQAVTVMETLSGKRARYKIAFRYTPTSAGVGAYASVAVQLPSGYVLEAFEGFSAIYNSNGKPTASSAQVQYGVMTFMCEVVDNIGCEVVFVVRQP